MNILLEQSSCASVGWARDSIVSRCTVQLWKKWYRYFTGQLNQSFSCLTTGLISRQSITEISPSGTAAVQLMTTCCQVLYSAHHTSVPPEIHELNKSGRTAYCSNCHSSMTIFHTHHSIAIHANVRFFSKLLVTHSLHGNFPSVATDTNTLWV